MKLFFSAYFSNVLKLPFLSFPNLKSLPITKYLILCQRCIKDAQKYLPEFLETIIKKNLFCIQKILTPDNRMPLFNGGIEENLKKFIDNVSEIEIEKKVKKNVIGGI